MSVRVKRERCTPRLISPTHLKSKSVAFRGSLGLAKCFFDVLSVRHSSELVDAFHSFKIQKHLRASPKFSLECLSLDLLLRAVQILPLLCPG